jgi:uncharacterized protein DUF937
MSLFQTILDSVANPQHAGTNADLGGLANLAQLIPGAGQNLQPILGAVGQHVQEALNEQQQAGGQAAAQQTVSNLAQSQNIGVSEIQNFLGQDRFNSLVNVVSENTGMSPQMVLTLLPMLVPVVMRLLATGTHQTNPQAPNPVLNEFLGGQNGGAMLGEMFQLASQFMRR